MIEDPDPVQADADALFARFRDHGDAPALGALFDLLSPTLFRMALALAPDPASAEDALQETFLAAMGSADRHDPSRPVTPWLVGILQLKVHEARRRARKAPDPTRLPPPLFPGEPSAAAEGAEEVERVRAAMDALPEPYRSVAVLRWRYGMEPAEIADARNENPATVRSHLHRAKERLRETLGVLPAVLLLPGERAVRGLDPIRAAVMEKAAVLGAATAAAAATGALATAAATGGVLVMTAKTAAAGAAVLALALGAWFALRPLSGPPAPVFRSLTAADRILPLPAPEPTPPPPPAPAPAAALPGPVDLDACDRDLDLFGVVVDEAGAPLPGAMLEVLLDPRRGSSLLLSARDLPPVVEGSTRSASDGTFRFRLARGVARDLRATLEGRAETVLPNCLAGERLRVILRRGGELVVLALDSKRNPVEGARVSLSRYVDGAEPVFEKTGRTDAAGRCAFPALVPGRVDFHVTSRGCAFGEGSFTSVPREGSFTVEVVLRDRPTVYGTVLDATTRAPVAGARVHMHSATGDAYLTDDAGRFAFPGWSTDGVYSLLVDAEGYGSAPAFVTPGTSVEVLLTAEDRVEGRVLDTAGVPVAGALVTALGPYKDIGQRRWDGDPARTVPSGADGSFRIPSLRHDLSHVLVVRAEGHGLLVRPFDPAPMGAGTIALGDLALPREASVEGTLRDRKGDPVPLSLVSLEGPKEGYSLGLGYEPVERRRTDDLGRFRFRGLAPGSFRVSPTKDRYAPDPVCAEVTLAEGEEVRGLELRLTGGTLTALVLDPSGAPVAGVPAIASFPAEEFWRLHRWTDADGRAFFESLPPGKVCLQSGVFEGSGMPFTVSELTEPLDADGSEVTLVLRAKSFIRGKVLAADGSPLEGVEIRAMNQAQSSLTIAVSDAGGAFALEAAAGDPLNLVVNGTVWKDRNDRGTRGPSSLRASLPLVPVPSEGVEIRIGAPNLKTLTVRLVGPDGNPVSGVTLLNWGAQPPPRVVTGADGRARFENLLPEECIIRCYAGNDLPEGCVSPALVRVVPDGQEIELRLRRGVPFSGRVLRDDGRPAVGAVVVADDGDGCQGITKTGSDGGFTIRVLPGTPIKDLSSNLSTGDGGREAVRVQDVDPDAGPVTLRLEPVGE